MTNDIDIERALRRFKTEPGAGVKRSVMSRFALGFDTEPSSGSAFRFWERPVPFRLAAAMLVIAVGLSFAAGRMMHRRIPQADSLGGAIWEQGALATEQVSWHVTPADLLSKGEEPERRHNSPG